MSLVSMTGHGRGEASKGKLRVAVELSSVNRKQLDIQLSTPRSLAALESRIHEEIHGAVSRGRISGEISLAGEGEASRRRLVVNRTLARDAIEDLRQAAHALKLEDDLTARSLLQIPQLLQVEDIVQDIELIWPVVRRALRAALRQLVAMRRREGAALKADLAARLGTLGALAEAVVREAPKVAERYRTALLARIEKAGLSVRLDDERLVREIVFFADRSDITEETTRLGSHLRQARTLLGGREPAGRTLDFLSQELLREINTVGSKANDAEVLKHVVAFKSELERFREQVQNVE